MLKGGIGLIEWTKATYSDSQVKNRTFITTLVHVVSEGRYNIYRMTNGTNVVIFDNQPKLLELVKSNLGSAFLIKFLHMENNKYSYEKEVDGKMLEVFTVARAAVVIPGTEENPVELVLGTDIPFIEEF
jgi:hypothetical protein